MLERLAGRTWNAIAEGLDDDEIPTARGAYLWQVGSVQSVYKSIRGRAFREKLDTEAALAQVTLEMPASSAPESVLP